MIRRHVLVHGSVQGVGFRYSAAAVARTRGVTGWIRNRPDGAVEAVFEGADDAVESMLEWCERGPRGAEVDAVDVSAEPPEDLQRFEIRGP